MARPNTQQRRRTELIEAVIEAAAHRGLRHLSLTDVADHAGVTRGALLYYYDDLEAILVEAHAAGMQRVGEERRRLVDMQSTPESKLAAAIDAGLPSGPDDAIMRVLYEFDVLAGKSPLHDELVQKLYREQLDMYLQILRDGVAAGAFSLTGDLDDIAMNFVALEDAYGLHIVAGGSISVEAARRAIRLYARQSGAAVEDQDQTPDSRKAL